MMHGNKKKKIKMETNTGKILTAIATIGAIVIGVKNYKKPGFWIGVGAMALLGVSITTYKAKE